LLYLAPQLVLVFFQFYFTCADGLSNCSTDDDNSVSMTVNHGPDEFSLYHVNPGISVNGFFHVYLYACIHFKRVPHALSRQYIFYRNPRTLRILCVKATESVTMIRLLPLSAFDRWEQCGIGVGDGGGFL